MCIHTEIEIEYALKTKILIIYTLFILFKFALYSNFTNRNQFHLQLLGVVFSKVKM